MLVYLNGWIASESQVFSSFGICGLDLHLFASVSQESKQQILQPLSVLRPKFRVRSIFRETVIQILI